jgi:hypothetical protein
MTLRQYIAALLRRAFTRPWQFALAAATVVGVLAALLTWLAPSSSSYALFATWFVPVVIFLILLLRSILLAPFWLLKESRAQAARLREELDAIEHSRPKVEVHSVRQAQLYRPLHTAAGKGPIYNLLQVWFKNQPAASTEKAIARDVAAEITFTGPRSCRIYGQWAVGNPPDFVGSGSIAPTVDIPPGPLPVKLNLALKYLDDSYAYGFSQEGITRDADGKDKASELPSGSYLVTIRLQGVGIDQDYRFRLENLGAGRDLQLTSQD